MRISLISSFHQWLAAGGNRIGEVSILPNDDGWLICHHGDTAHAGSGILTRHATPESAREVSKYDAARRFRPLKSAPTLVTGWEIILPDISSLHLALDFLYPAALANWLRTLDGSAAVVPLRDALNRQTGIYRVTALINDDEAHILVGNTCGETKCLRQVLWKLSAETSWATLPTSKQKWPVDQPACGCPIPLICTDACPLLIGEARSTVKARMKASPAVPTVTE